MFQAIYSFEGHKAYASQVGRLLGYQGKAPHARLNSEVGLYAKRIAKIYDIDFMERIKRKCKFWDLFFNGWKGEERGYFVWQLKPALAEALRESRLTEEQPYAEEIIDDDVGALSEGIKKTVAVNTYERNLRARLLCIEHWKPVCIVCNFDFESVYGRLWKGYIHVHHLISISKIGGSYNIDPINDLRPVCPNCHSMLHARNPPLTINELQKIIENIKINR